MTGGRLNASQLVLVLAASSVPAIPARADEPRIDEAAIEAYTTTELKKGGYPSLSIGIVDGQGLHFAKGYGLADRASGRQATPESLYYIGSVTKVFTTTLMCILRDRGILRLDDPISKYLPEGVKLPSDPRGAPEITLRHLATHTSGLPRLPPNLTAKGRDPYGGYTVEQLYAGLGQVKLVRPVGAECRYSTLGAGLLGHVLERAAGEPYEKLLAKHLLDPLGMKDTSVTLTSRQRRMLTVGYKGRDFRKKASPWNFGCLEGAGALVSSVADLARFLSLQLKAGQADVRPVSGGTLTELHTPQRLTGGWDGAVGLGWHITPAEGIGDVVWHNGGVDGHFAFIGFLRDPAIGVIVLTNAGKLVDQIGWVLLALAAARPKPPTSTTQALPAAQEILDAHVAATGGREARERIHNVVKRGAANIAGMQARFESYNAEPARAYMKMSMGPLTIAEEGVDGTIAWEITPQERVAHDRRPARPGASPSRSSRRAQVARVVQASPVHGPGRFRGPSLLRGRDDAQERPARNNVLRPRRPPAHRRQVHPRAGRIRRADH